MNRRQFLKTGLVGSFVAPSWLSPVSADPVPKLEAIRDAFPRLKHETYLNAASLMPLSTFSQKGLSEYIRFQQEGPRSGADKYIGKMWSEVRGLFASLIGAEKDEIGLVYCTKAGEQIALDAVDHIRPGGNIVTNDLHFSGSLHNLVGIQKAGRDVRFVRANDFHVSFEEMKAAIDARTALVTITLLSNVNGHIEEIKEIAALAHKHGALVYADIIQAAGILPLNMAEMDIDIAACSCYKWLYGVYGSGFLYVRKSLQGTTLPNRIFPGRAHPNYIPWTDNVDPSHEAFSYRAPKDASRYEPGHVNYMGYCAAYEGLKFLHKHGVENLWKHSVALNQRLIAALDPKRYRCISPHTQTSPIVTFLTDTPDEVKARLKKANVVVTQIDNRIRVSPAVFNTEADIDLLAQTLNA